MMTMRPSHNRRNRQDAWASGVCPCGHPAAAHEHVPGVRFERRDVTVSDEDGNVLHGLPDVWVCSGGRLVLNPTEDTSPWDYVCGCVLHAPPTPDPARRRDAA